MPRAPRLCGRGDCLELAITNGTRCDVHQREADERQAQWTATHRKPDTRPSASQRGYGAEWRKLRARVLREEPTCRRCGGITKQIDHIIPKTRGGTNDRENLQGLCFSCHSRKTITEDGGLIFGRKWD